MANRITSDNDLCVIALVKGSERYILLYPPGEAFEAGRVVARWAKNPELSFSWYDAACLVKRIRQETGA